MKRYSAIEYFLILVTLLTGLLFSVYWVVFSVPEENMFAIITGSVLTATTLILLSVWIAKLNDNIHSLRKRRNQR